MRSINPNVVKAVRDCTMIPVLHVSMVIIGFDIFQSIIITH
jgi:hypothetical protein